jgi:16S rRNA (guanine527-N7)-methyltransferase
VAEHLADSLSGLEVEPLRHAGRIADVGAGAGFPGLPLAVALPTARVDLIESSRRKAELIARLAEAAGVKNARAVRARAEDWSAPDAEGREAYDAVTARALAPLAVLVEYAAPLLREGGALVAWKGARDDAEEEGGAAAGAATGMAPREVLRVTPFAGARHRHLHLFEKVAPTPPGLPRRPGVARKRPLGD